MLDALERLAAGQDDVPLPVKPSQVAAALLRIMLRQKIVTQQELLDELLRKSGLGIATCQGSRCWPRWIQKGAA